MRKVKSFSEWFVLERMEEEINKFLGESEMELVDVKYAAVYEETEKGVMHSALVIYETE